MEVKDFKPYSVYRKNIKELNRFAQLTVLAYGLAEQLLFKYPKEKLPAVEFEKPQSLKDGISYTDADLTVAEIGEVCSWVSLEDYAKRVNSDLEFIKGEVEKGNLGHYKIDNENGKTWIIWPPEQQDRRLDELPEIGKKLFNVKYDLKVIGDVLLDTADLSSFEETQYKFLHLAHSLGKREEVHARSQEALTKSCFIQHWTAFESFLKESIRELFKAYPATILVGKSNKNSSIKYEELFKLSSEFKSLDSLLNSLVEKEIEKQESEGKSVHGLINFLNTEFRFEKNPYESSYVLKGTRYKTHYNDLMEIKDVRNALLHNAGHQNSDFFEKYPNVPRRENDIAINDDYYLKSRLILDAIAHSIAKSISNLNTMSSAELVQSDVQ